MNTGTLENKRAISWSKTWLSQSGRWRVLVVVGALVAAAVLGRAPSRMVLVLLAVAGGGLFVLKQDVRNLLLAFPAVALFVPFQINTGTEVSLNAAVLGVIGLVILGIIQKSFHRDWRLVPSRLYRPLIALSIVSILSLFVGNITWDLSVPRPPNMLLVQIGQLAIYFLSFLMFWFTAFMISDLSWLRRLTYALIITGGVGMVLVLFSTLLGVRLPVNSMMLNMFTVWLVPLTFVMIGADPELTAQKRRLLVGALALAVAAIAWIWFIRADWIGGWGPPMVALGILLWFRYPRLRIPIVLVALTILIFIGAEAFLLTFDFDLEEKWDISGGSRVTLWRSVIELASPRPLLGLGIAAYRHYHFLKPLAYGRALWIRPTVSAHNMFVDMFAQMGILGLACYLWFLGEALLLAWRLHLKSTGFARGYALVAFCTLIGIMTADMLAATSLPFVYNMSFPGFRASVVSWMMLGGLVVLENQCNEEHVKLDIASDSNK